MGEANFPVQIFLEIIANSKVEYSWHSKNQYWLMRISAPEIDNNEAKQYYFNFGGSEDSEDCSRIGSLLKQCTPEMKLQERL